MNSIAENWLSVGAGIFLLGMMLHGHYRGAVRQCVSLGALILTIVLVKIGTPYMTQAVRENPAIRQNAAEAILNAAGWKEDFGKNSEVPAVQRTVIENLNLPDPLKDLLLENNNSEFYSILGVEQFAEYVSTYLADILIHTVGSAILFAVIYSLIHMLVRWLHILSRLPILYGLDHIAGAVLGVFQGLVLLWLGCFVVGLCSATSWGRELEQQIQASAWLSFLYQYNMIHVLLGSVIRGIL